MILAWPTLATQPKPVLIVDWATLEWFLLDPSNGAKYDTLLITIELRIIFLNGIGILGFLKKLLTEKRALLTLLFMYLTIGSSSSDLLKGIPRYVQQSVIGNGCPAK